jgi:hypothetical protein
LEKKLQVFLVGEKTPRVSWLVEISRFPLSFSGGKNHQVFWAGLNLQIFLFSFSQDERTSRFSERCKNL